jgi:hypothetical protein
MPGDSSCKFAGNDGYGYVWYQDTVDNALTCYEAGAGTPTVKWTATSTPPVQVSVVPLYAGLFEDAPQPVTGPLSGPVSCSLDGD